MPVFDLSATNESMTVLDRLQESGTHISVNSTQFMFEVFRGRTHLPSHIGGGRYPDIKLHCFSKRLVLEMALRAEQLAHAFPWCLLVIEHLSLVRFSMKT